MASLAEEDVEAFVADAEKKGLLVVSDESTVQLLKEFEGGLAESERLCGEDDESGPEPYKWRYAARTLLDGLVNKLEATRTIAMVEGKKDRIAEMDWRLACARVKLGGISWEVEEPHNAQSELELAVEYYAPRFVAAVSEMVGDDEESEVAPAEGPEPNPSSDKFSPPPIAINAPIKEHRADAMKCLNMLGILWAGRGQVRKSFMYLLAAKRLYQTKEDEELESVYTHNLFYLAQAYGKIGDTGRSSSYCHETLQRQLLAGFVSPRSALDWAKNCASISDFYKSMRHYRRCALALASAEAVIQKHVIDKDDEQSAQVVADINCRWAALDLLVLKRAYDRESKRLNSIEMDYALDPEEQNDEGEDDLGAAAAATASANASESVFSANATFSLFTSLPVSSVPYLCVGDVTTFDHARVVFLRAATRIEAAKKYYQIDGYVTDHTNLLHDNSRLYHYLSIFEPDVKRKLAMESRRVDMLQPLIGKLSKTAFEALHKQLSFEVGEAYMSLLEIKSDKLKGDWRAKGGTVFDERCIKRADMTKMNSYALGALAMLTHYLSFFARGTDPHGRGGGSKPFSELSFQELFAIDFRDPDETLVTEEELRSFFNAHFYSCRVLSKITTPPDAPPQERSLPLTTCLRRYEWLHKIGPGICSRKGVKMDDVFLNENQIIEEMVKLLPSKIDRIFYRGESGML